MTDRPPGGVRVGGQRLTVGRAGFVSGKALPRPLHVLSRLPQVGAVGVPAVVPLPEENPVHDALDARPALPVRPARDRLVSVRGRVVGKKRHVGPLADGA